MSAEWVRQDVAIKYGSGALESNQVPSTYEDDEMPFLQPANVRAREFFNSPYRLGILPTKQSSKLNKRVFT